MPHYTLTETSSDSQLPPLVRFEAKNDEVAVVQAKRTAKSLNILNPELFQVRKVPLDSKS
jgi:hypothetical protein